MDLIADIVDLLLHLDRHLDQIIRDYGAWTYLILFAVVFCETGLVITPFLPGDSLLFAVGTFAARGSLDLTGCLLLLSAAGILGDSVNYWIGGAIGPAVFHRSDSRLFNRKHLERTQLFYEKYGSKTIVLARFVPIVRTFAPFVAGIGRMAYGRFLAYNLIGGLAWVGVFVMGGYWFGNLEIVRNNFPLVILAIIILSILPAVVEILRHRRGGARG